jgi:hypothetical protein
MFHGYTLTSTLAVLRCLSVLLSGDKTCC